MTEGYDVSRADQVREKFLSDMTEFRSVLELMAMRPADTWLPVEQTIAQNCVCFVVGSIIEREKSLKDENDTHHPDE